MNTIIEWTFELRFLLALALGFLIGLERESSKTDPQKPVFAGVRTFPIISMFGFGCAYLYQIGATFMLPVGLLTIGALATMAYVAKVKAGHFGLTSEICALLIFIVGSLSLLVDVWIPMALAVVITILLSEKAELENYVERLDRVEFLATLKFILVTVIILPVLPNQEYTQFKLNPTKIWWIVILVSTVGFVGYYLSKRFGSKIGLWMSGLLGGIVSSTAVTVAVGRIAKAHPDRSNEALQASILASSVMYLRILVLIWVLNFSFVQFLWWRLVLLACFGFVLSIHLMVKKQNHNNSEMPSLQNPFEIKPAIFFAVLFLALSVITKLIESYIGNAGIVLLSTIVGVTDIDPFILSIVQNSEAMTKIACTAIIIAMMSNTIVKAIYFTVLAPGVRKETITRFAIWAALHIPFMFF